MELLQDLGHNNYVALRFISCIARKITIVELHTILKGLTAEAKMLLTKTIIFTSLLTCTDQNYYKFYLL